MSSTLAPGRGCRGSLPTSAAPAAGHHANWDGFPTYSLGELDTVAGISTQGNRARPVLLLSWPRFPMRKQGRSEGPAIGEYGCPRHCRRLTIYGQIRAILSIPDRWKGIPGHKPTSMGEPDRSIATLDREEHQEVLVLQMAPKANT